VAASAVQLSGVARRSAEGPAGRLEAVDPHAVPVAQGAHVPELARPQPNIERTGVRGVTETLGELDDVTGLAQVVPALPEAGGDDALDRHAPGSLEDPTVAPVLRSKELHAPGRELETLPSVRQGPHHELAPLEVE